MTILHAIRFTAIFQTKTKSGKTVSITSWEKISSGKKTGSQLDAVRKLGKRQLSENRQFGCKNNEFQQHWSKIDTCITARRV